MATKPASDSSKTADFAAVEAVIADAAKHFFEYRGERYPVHPAAHVLPLLEGERYRELLEDCRENGVLEPVRLLDGAVLDGRNRMRIAIEADLDLEFEHVSSALDPCRTVAGRNVLRRHLSPQQRLLAAKTLRDMSLYYSKRRSARVLENLRAEPKHDPVSGEVEGGEAAGAGGADARAGSGGDPGGAPAPPIGASDTPGMGAHDPLPVRPSAAPSGGPVAPKAKDKKDARPGFTPTAARGTATTTGASSKQSPSDDGGDSDGEGSFMAPLSTSAVADSMGVSRRQLQRADELVADVPDLVDAVKDGVVSLGEALDPEVKAAPEEVRREALAEVKEKGDGDGAGAGFKAAVQRRQEERGIASGPKKRKPAQPKGRKSGSAAPAGVTQIQELPDLTTSHRGGSTQIAPADDPATAHDVYSPELLVKVVRVTLGVIDLDPASSEEAQIEVAANKWYGREEDGLTLPWKGNVYCFAPPNLVGDFADKLGRELMAGNAAASVFVAPTQSGAHWAQKLLVRPELTMIVMMRGDEPLVMESLEKGGRPGVWRAPLGLTAFLFGVEPTPECCERWAVWGIPFVLAPRAAKAA